MNSRPFLAAALAAAILCLPPTVAAQTANTPGGQAATGSGLDQTTKNPQETTSGRTRTTTDMTNPKGTMSPKDDDAKTKRGAANRTKPGDVPTYPAPAPGGEPTK